MFLTFFFKQLCYVYLKKQISIDILSFFYKFSFVKKSWSFFLYFMLVLLFSTNLHTNKLSISAAKFFIIFFFIFPKYFFKKYSLSGKKATLLTSTEFFFSLYPDLKYFQKFSLVFKSLVFRF